MTPVLRRAIPVLMAALAIANTGCGSKSSERTPTGPQPPASGDEGRLSAMADAPPFGVALDSFAVVAASTVTNTGSTVVNGDLGLSPGAVPGCSITGFPPGIVNGMTQACNATSLAAQNAVGTVFGALDQPCDITFPPGVVQLAGQTLTPGVYCLGSALLDGTLTLNALGNANSVWVFKISSTITTGTNSQVVFLGGVGQACAVFWRVGSSATLGGSTQFQGNIFAQAAITLVTTARNSGGLFARTEAVTLDTNVVTRVGSCGGGPQPTPTPLASPTPIPPTPGPGASPVPTLPEVAMWGLMAILLATGVFIISRR